MALWKAMEFILASIMYMYFVNIVGLNPFQNLLSNVDNKLKQKLTLSQSSLYLSSASRSRSFSCSDQSLEAVAAVAGFMTAFLQSN